MENRKGPSSVDADGDVCRSIWDSGLSDANREIQNACPTLLAGIGGVGAKTIIRFRDERNRASGVSDPGYYRFLKIPVEPEPAAQECVNLSGSDWEKQLRTRLSAVRQKWEQDRENQTDCLIGLPQDPNRYLQAAEVIMESLLVQDTSRPEDRTLRDRFCADFQRMVREKQPLIPALPRFGAPALELTAAKVVPPEALFRRRLVWESCSSTGLFPSEEGNRTHDDGPLTPEQADYWFRELMEPIEHLVPVVMGGTFDLLQEMHLAGEDLTWGRIRKELTECPDLPYRVRYMAWKRVSNESLHCLEKEITAHFRMFAERAVQLLCSCRTEDFLRLYNGFGPHEKGIRARMEELAGSRGTAEIWTACDANEKYREFAAVNASICAAPCTAEYTADSTRQQQQRDQWLAACNRWAEACINEVRIRHVTGRYGAFRELLLGPADQLAEHVKSFALQMRQMAALYAPDGTDERFRTLAERRLPQMSPTLRRSMVEAYLRVPASQMNRELFESSWDRCSGLSGKLSFREWLALVGPDGSSAEERTAQILNQLERQCACSRPASQHGAPWISVVRYPRELWDSPEGSRIARAIEAQVGPAALPYAAAGLRWIERIEMALRLSPEESEQIPEKSCAAASSGPDEE